MNIFKADIVEFFEKLLEKRHNLQEILEGVQETCDTSGISELLVKISSNNYGLKDKECYLSQLLKIFYEKREQSLSGLLQFLDQFYQQTNFVDDKRCTIRGIVCKNDVKPCSCEAETNQLGCNLLKLFDNINATNAKVDEIMSRLLEIVAKTLYNSARTFDLEYGLSCSENLCNSNGKTSRDISAAMEAFIIDFTQQFAEAQVELSDSINIVKEENKLIKDFQQKQLKL